MKSKFCILHLAIFSFLFTTVGHSQSVLGKWEVTNDEGRVNSIMEIYAKDNEVYGKVIEITKEEDRNRLCTECEGDLKNKPIQGMVLMSGFEKDGDQYVGGTIIDPKTGKKYNGKLWLDEEDPNKLKIRGYIAFFYRTKTWERSR